MNSPSRRVNLVQNSMKTKISSPQISSDGYGITNLLSNTNGFLVEHFIKPPVFIEFDFMCNMFVHEVILNTRVGTQKSKGIEILVNESTVGKCYLTADQDVVRWVRNSNTEVKDSATGQNIATCDFFGGAHKHLNSTNRMTIKIFKTENSSLVSVKSLKIIGSINKRTNPREVFSEFVDLLNQTSIKPSLNHDRLRKHSSNKDEVFDSKLASVKCSEEIPEDFIDPITHEFMTNPFILPCGKIIDKSTLDKYLEHELKWNRLANDPFTGVKFNVHQKPVQAIHLKSRIDKFLFLNQNHSLVEKLPRTFQNIHSQNRHKNLLFKMVGDKQINHGLTIHENNTDLTKCQSNESRKRRKLSCSNQDTSLEHLFSHSKRDQNESENIQSVPSICTNIGPILQPEKEHIIDLTDDGTTHLENNLDNQIQNTLKDLPSFIMDNSTVSSVQTQIACVNCSQTKLLYKIITCTHHICRQCLVSIKEGVCKICDISFSSSDVIRVFNS